MITREETRRIWDEVKDNHRKLDECRGPHDFSIDAEPSRPLWKKWTCTKCGGTVDQSAKMWYELGRSALSNEKVKVRREDVIDRRAEWTPLCNEPVLVVRADRVEIIDRTARTEEHSNG